MITALKKAVLVLALILSGAAPGAGLAAMLATHNVAVATVTPPALFVVAHPDDETLLAAVPIAEHLQAGQDVHVLLMTDGEASGVLSDLNGTTVNAWWGVAHNPAAEGYSTLTAADMAAARVAEFNNALYVLGSGYPGTLTIHQAHLPDGGVTVATAQAAILEVADAIAPSAPVRLKGHTYSTSLENHPDHLAIGQAIAALGVADPVRFGDRRYYVEPGFWSATATGITLSWDLPGDATITAHAKNATRCYGSWSPPYSYAIGYHSKSDWLNTMQSTPKARQHS